MPHKAAQHAPESDAIIAAYAAATQMVAYEGQLIWQRNGSYLLFNTIVATVLVAIRPILASSSNGAMTPAIAAAASAATGAVGAKSARF